MPKIFSEVEKKAIKVTLAEVGIRHFAARGLRSTRIEDICRDVGIAKGSFYNFFASKEALFMSIADERDAMHKADILAYLNKTHPDKKPLVAGFFKFLMDRIETDPILKILHDTSEIISLMRKLPPEQIVKKQERDKEFVITIADLMQKKHGLVHATAEALESLMVMMLSLSLQAEFIKAMTDYPATISILRDAFLTRLLKGPYYD